MRAFPGWIGRALAALLLVVAMVTADGVAAQTVTPAGAQTEAPTLALGERALAAHQPAQARQIALALLARNPNDIAVLLLRARAARALGDTPEALAAARKAWRLARVPVERFAAALVRAQVLSSSGHRTMAQLWLRRAVEDAPDARARAVAVRDYRFVRARNPWVLHLRFSLSPSSNVNNGSSSSTTLLFGLPFTLSPDAKALSGGIGQADFSAVYRLRPTVRTRTELRLSGMTRNVWLSPVAKAEAPMAKGRAYDYGALQFGLWQEFRRAPAAPVVWHWSAALGRNWYGGSVLSDYRTIGLGAERPLSPRVAALWDLSYERQDRHDLAQRSADVVTGEVGLAWRLANGDRLQLSFGARHTHSLATDIAHRTRYATLNWSMARPVAGVAVGLQLSALRRVYSAFPYTVGGRHDLVLQLDLTLVFTRLSYMGFSPSLDITYSHTASNLGLYRSRGAGVLFGFRSQF